MTLRQRIDAIVREVAEMPPNADVPADLPLAQLGIDSLRALEILLRIEEEFGTVIPDELLQPELFGSVDQLSLTVQDFLEPTADAGSVQVA